MCRGGWQKIAMLYTKHTALIFTSGSEGDWRLPRPSEWCLICSVLDQNFNSGRGCHAQPVSTCFATTSEARRSAKRSAAGQTTKGELSLLCLIRNPPASPNVKRMFFTSHPPACESRQCYCLTYNFPHLRSTTSDQRR